MASNWQVIASVAICFVPVIGPAYMLASAVAGQDLITGTKLSGPERFLCALGGLALAAKAASTLAKAAGPMFKALGRFSSGLSKLFSGVKDGQLAAKVSEVTSAARASMGEGIFARALQGSATPRESCKALGRFSSGLSKLFSGVKDGQLAAKVSEVTSAARASMGEGIFARALSGVGNTARELRSAVVNGGRRLLSSEQGAVRLGREATLSGDDLARLAHDAHESLTGFLQASTVAAGIKDGRVVYSVFGGGRNLTIKAIEALRAQGLRVLNAPAVLSESYHAERQLYNIGIREIGISRKKGMCEVCDKFFSAVDATVTPYGG